MKMTLFVFLLLIVGTAHAEKCRYEITPGDIILHKQLDTDKWDDSANEMLLQLETSTPWGGETPYITNSVRNIEKVDVTKQLPFCLKDANHCLTATAYPSEHKHPNMTAILYETDEGYRTILFGKHTNVLQTKVIVLDDLQYKPCSKNPVDTAVQSCSTVTANSDSAWISLNVVKYCYPQ